MKKPTFKKLFPLIALSGCVLAVAVYFYPLFQEVDSASFGPTEVDSDQSYQEKLTDFDQFLSESKSSLEVLNAESDQRMQADQALEETLKKLDATLGVTEEEFERQYPGFKQQ